MEKEKSILAQAHATLREARMAYHTYLQGYIAASTPAEETKCLYYMGEYKMIIKELVDFINNDLNPAPVIAPAIDLFKQFGKTH